MRKPDFPHFNFVVRKSLKLKPKIEKMKKFITDNVYIFVIVAIILGGYAAYSIYKASKEEEPTE